MYGTTAKHNGSSLDQDQPIAFNEAQAACFTEQMKILNPMLAKYRDVLRSNLAVAVIRVGLFDASNLPDLEQKIMGSPIDASKEKNVPANLELIDTPKEAQTYINSELERKSYGPDIDATMQMKLSFVRDHNGVCRPRSAEQIEAAIKEELEKANAMKQHPGLLEQADLSMRILSGDIEAIKIALTPRENVAPAAEEEGKAQVKLIETASIAQELPKTGTSSASVGDE
ncbi:MAG: hypothetical protein AB1540_13110 [Bdellovibrionota bacterium]